MTPIRGTMHARAVVAVLMCCALHLTSHIPDVYVTQASCGASFEDRSKRTEERAAPGRQGQFNKAQEGREKGPHG